jgi:hypothetical protein
LQAFESPSVVRIKMQAAADAASRFWAKYPGVAADVTRPRGTFARPSKDLLHVRAPDIPGGYMQPEFSEPLFRLKQIDSDRTEIGRSAFDDRDPTGPNPDLHARIVASVR